MPAIVPRTINDLAKATDPKSALMEKLGSALDGIEVFGAQVLVGTYIPPERIGSIILTDKAKEEALWQGSLGLVLKKGPWAFKDDPDNNIHWDGQNVSEGEWVLFRFSSAWEQHFNGVSVRFVDDRDIRGKVADPALMSNIPIIS